MTKKKLLAKMGAPELLTDKLIGQLVKPVTAGCTREVAAQAVGIGRSTFYKWRKRGEEEQAAGVAAEESVYVRFVLALDRAEAQGEAVMVQVIATSGVQGMMWILQRRHPERWQDSQKIKLELERRADELIDQLKEGLSDAEFSKVLAVLAAGGATGD